MCGIAGYLDLGGARTEEELRRIAGRMAETLRHRGPDDSGTWADAQAGIAFGHCRLSIVDLSPEGRQPMQCACGRFVTAYNGEIYNFLELRADLEKLGCVFRGRSDTEVLLAAICEWGLGAALERANGMFAIALWDRREHELHLVRDRMGKKPLYYGWMGSSFLFASEVKAIRAHPDFRGEIDRDALALYLRYNYIPSPYSIYRGILKLPPAARLTLKDPVPGTLPEPAPYWSARDLAERGCREPFAGSPEDAAGQLDSLLRDAVRMRMIADVPLGAFLSGGIDSSTVVALMQAQSARPVRTFSIGFHEPRYNEAVHASEIARRLGTEHTELYVTAREAMDVIPRLPHLYDEPFADSSQIPTFLVSEMTRRYVTVSLSGDGGDELFGGYDTYFAGRRIMRRTGWMPRSVRRGLGRAIGAVPPEAWQEAFRALSPVLPGRITRPDTGERLHRLAGAMRLDDLESVYRGIVSKWLDPCSVVIGASEPPTAFTDRSRWLAVKDAAQRMMYLDAVTYLPDDILVKVDRASMGVSLEARAPLLDHRVAEFAWRLPLPMKLRGEQGKWLLRQVLYRYVPREMVERPKMGFALPVGEWLRGPLRDWAEALLGEDRMRREGFFRPEPVRRKWLEHLSGERSWQPHLWCVLMFHAWLDAARGAGPSH